MEGQNHSDSDNIRFSKRKRLQYPKSGDDHKDDLSDAPHFFLPSNDNAEKKVLHNWGEIPSSSGVFQTPSIKRPRDDCEREPPDGTTDTVPKDPNLKLAQRKFFINKKIPENLESKIQTYCTPNDKESSGLANLVKLKLTEAASTRSVASFVIDEKVQEPSSTLTNTFQVVNDKFVSFEHPTLPLIEQESDKPFRFFWWDAFEDSKKEPGVILLFGKTYNITKNIYSSCCVAVRNIKRRVFFLPRVTQQDTGEPVTANDVYEEVKVLMKQINIVNFKAKIVTKKYVFDPEVPLESDYVEVRYSAKDSSISRSTSGKTFSRVFGTCTSYLEILLLDREIKGPCWLDVSNPCILTEQASWCSFDVDCNKVSDLAVKRDVIGKPPLVVLSFSAKRVIRSFNKINEIVMLGGAVYKDYSVDKEASTTVLQHKFCVVSSPSWLPFPNNLLEELKKYDGFQKVQSERMLLNHFIIKFLKFDPDIIVGHDIQDHFIEMISEKLALYNVTRFSQLSRIRSQSIIKQTLQYELFTGRLVCDIKISAKEFIQCRSYNMQTLCETVLEKTAFSSIDYDSRQILAMYEDTKSICQLASFIIQEAFYIFDIMISLNIIPTVLEITNIAGNLMSKNLLGGRYGRNESLLLHAFTKNNHIVPDKEFKPVESKKIPNYKGGLVLEPKIGIYNKYILLMDFKSLYPSIIQEYNICFTTTMPPTFSEDGMIIPHQNSSTGVLPQQIGELLENRRQIKKLMSDSAISSDLKFSYNVRQMAFKLTANSLYGCLGLSNSRFSSRNLAALITCKGREILRHTKELVTKMDLEVIYGDTDSLMINTNSVDYDQAFQLGNIIKAAVNEMYKNVELDIDCLFKNLLLLRKKKYAAVTVFKSKDGHLLEECIYKGMEIIRRDCSRLASDAGKFVLEQIFTDQERDCCVKNIFNHLRQIKEGLENHNFPLSSLVIVQQLTKNLNTYNNKKALFHVEAALRFNKNYGGGLKAGDVVPYAICLDVTDEEPTYRAYHVTEIKANANLEIDINYYLSKQIYPVVSRICEPIKIINNVELVNALVSKKQMKIKEDIKAPSVQFAGADKFTFSCSKCKTINEIDGPLRNGIPVLSQCQNYPVCTARPVEYISDVLDQMEEQVSNYISKIYKKPSSSSKLQQRVQKEDLYSSSDLITQLKYFYYIFDLETLPTHSLINDELKRAYGRMQTRSRAQFFEPIPSHNENSINLHKIFSSVWKSYREVETDDWLTLNMDKFV